MDQPDQGRNQIDRRGCRGVPVEPRPRDDTQGGARTRKKAWLICASGPSLCAEDVEALRVKVDQTIVVNTTFRLVPDANILWATDAKWWNHYGDEVLRKFHGERWSTLPRDDDSQIPLPDVEKWGLQTWIGSRHRGLGRYDLHWGDNSGYSAINLAYLMGAHTIYLLGFDMGHAEDGKSHWHGDHPGHLNNGSAFKDWLQQFEDLARDLAKEGVKVINCTRRTALHHFPRATVEEICEPKNS